MELPRDIFTPISEVGEFGLIDRMKDILGASECSALMGIGDDAAVIKTGEDRVQLVTTDALIEGVHFDRTFTPLHYLGFKAIAVNVSDVIAMNGKPHYAVVSLGLPNDISVEMVETLYEGMKMACDAYNTEVVGGDTTGAGALTIAVTVFGVASEKEVCYRSGAQPGQLLCVSGDLGSAYAGLKVLQAQKLQFEEAGDSFQPNLDPFRYVVQRQLMPQARMDVFRQLRSRDITPSAMIDVSDGLASEVHHICSASGCGAIIQKDAVPIREETTRVAESSGHLPISYALHGGEDYELLFTLEEKDLEKTEGMPISVVGEITDLQNGITMVADEGEAEELERSGFRHF